MARWRLRAAVFRTFQILHVDANAASHAASSGPSMISRRQLLAGLGAAAVAACSGPARRRSALPDELVLSIAEPAQKRMLDEGMVGISHESSLLADPRWFAAQDGALVQLFRNLGRGVLSLGGDSRAFTGWQPQPSSSSAPPAPLRFAVTPGDIDRLKEFLDACGWSLIYSLNLGHGDADRAAAEAAYVSQRLGDRLLALQIGTAPDRYAARHLRPQGYDAAAFIREWQQYAAAIRARAGDVPLAGPDLSRASDWFDAFARSCGSQVRFLSEHYEATGPAENPRVDIASLWRSEFTRYPMLRQDLQRAAKLQRPLRVTAAGACSEGGKPGVSDTMAAALWAVATCYGFLRDGGDGFCFEGGATAPGAAIAGAPGQGYRARPLYYALLMLTRDLPARWLDAKLNVEVPPLACFAMSPRDGQLRVVIVNRSQGGAVDLRIKARRPLQRGTALRLWSPTLFNTDGVTLGGAGVAADGGWQPQPETAVVADGDAFVTVGAASALQLNFEV
jgi:hypothetical protein